MNNLCEIKYSTDPSWVVGVQISKERISRARNKEYLNTDKKHFDIDASITVAFDKPNPQSSRRNIYFTDYNI